MIRSFSITKVINPYYVFLAGSLGIFIALIMLEWNYPLPGDQIGHNFVNAQPFLIWEFFLGIFCCLLTILFLPLWGLLFYLIRNQIYMQGARQKRQAIIYLSLRGILQNYLAILGVILSMVPINTAGFRAILIALDPKNDQAFPVTNVILYGLIFTVILLLIYIPAHLALSETSRKLRDRLGPLGSLDSLTKDLERRKALEELLQTNIGMIQNLKTSLITLAPLITSLVSSVLKINLPL